MLGFKWKKILSDIKVCFEPLVSTDGGRVYALNIVFENYENKGRYRSFSHLLDDAFDEGILYQVDIELRKEVFAKFYSLKMPHLKLIYPLDNRIMYMSDYRQGNSEKIINKVGIEKKNIYYEVCNKSIQKDPNSIKNIVNSYKSEGFEIVFKDFGHSMSSLELLYFSSPKIVKLDNFFMVDLKSSIKKQNFLKAVIELCHSLKIFTATTAVEDANDFYLLKELGVDFVSGALIQKPSSNIATIEKVSQEVQKLQKNDKRMHQNYLKDDYIQTDIEPLLIDASLHELFSYFQKNPKRNFVPIVDQNGVLEGVIYENDIKKISYSQYGLSLAKNNSFGAKMANFIKKAAWVEKSWGVDKTLELYNTHMDDNRGVFITKDGFYYGFISVKSLLELSYKRNLEIAQSQNPLSKLPGNSMIEKFLQRRRTQNNETTHIVYFDFNDFKPFNDSYGFRQGDRAILMFSDILKKRLQKHGFIAHIGGDDFFVGLEGYEYEKVYKLVFKVCNEFKEQASSLYKSKDRDSGYIITKDRFGTKRKFSLLSVSAAILESHRGLDVANLDSIMSVIKKSSKASDMPVGVSVALK